MSEFKPALKLADVPEGQGRTAFVEGRQIALFNLGGEIFALDGACPHKQGPLGSGFCEEGHVYCPMHGWKFDIRSGACIDFPGKNAVKFPARVAGEMIEVAL